MITIGVDAHKTIHVALALGESGETIGHWRGANSPAGWQELYEWSGQLSDERQWGIEGAWSNGRGLAQQLVFAGETVYDINPRWTAMGRRTARKPDKTDSLDARAIALFVRREAPSLPRVSAEDDTTVFDLLTSEREAAVSESTRLRNQIHAHLLQIDPQYKLLLHRLKSELVAEALESLFLHAANSIAAHRVEAVRRLLERLKLAEEHAACLAAEIRALARDRLEPLTRLCGVNLLTAGTLAGILGYGPSFPQRR